VSLSSLRLRARRGTVFQVEGPDAFVGRASISAAAARSLSTDHLRVLAAFGAARRLDEVAATLVDLDPEEVEDLAEALLMDGLLEVADLPGGLDDGFGRLEAHLPLVADQVRVDAYARALHRQAPGLRVAELGCGTGLLSVLAARAGAASVWACEETDTIDLARAVLAANGLSERVVLVQGDSRDLAPPTPVDLLVHEVFGVDPFDEGLLSSLADARARWLAPGGRLLPQGLSVFGAAVGGLAWRRTPPLAEVLAALRERWELDLGPVLAAARGQLRRRPEAVTDPPDRACLLGEPSALLTLDLHAPGDLSAPRAARLDLPRGGTVDALLVWQRIDLDGHDTLSTGPWDPPTHWGWLVYDLVEPLTVPPGGAVELQVAVATVDGREELVLSQVLAVPVP